MKFLESLIFGFLTGLTELLPISSAAHQQLLGTILNDDLIDPVRNLFIHIAVLIAIYAETAHIRNSLSKATQSNRKRHGNSKAIAEHQFWRNTTVPFLIVFFLISYISPSGGNLLLVSFILLLNGVLLFLPDRMLQGNKNSKVMTKTDSALIGSFGALSALPGFSRIGGILFAASFRGADRKSAVNWALMLSIPALYALILKDLFAIFAGNSLPFWSNFFFYIITAVAAFIGCRAGLYALKRHIRRTGCASYAFYCWGAALFALILFLTIA